jgi:hypothetical protein
MKFFVLFVMLSIATFLAAQEGRGKDGHFHDPETGNVQPDTCDNSFKNTHPCTCEKTKSCDVKPEHDRTCQVYCRKDACRCLAECS